jgi:hypothetical protein
MAKTKKAHLGELQNYFKNFKLDSELKLSKNGQLKFHWANWDKTCLLQKSFSESDKSKLDLMNEALELLKSYPVWYQRNLVTVKSNLYELYSSYMDPRLKMTWHDLQKDTHVSLHHESGPYISLTSMRWMDKETYELFIYKKLLTSYHPMREFRVSSLIKATGEIDHSPLSKIDLKITQFSKKGMIVAISGHHFEKVKNCSDIKVEINLDAFSKLKNRNEIDKFNANKISNGQYINIKGHSIRQFGNLDNANSSNGSEYFFFIPYSELEIVGSNKGAHQLFGHFVEMLENFFTDELDFKSEEATIAA